MDKKLLCIGGPVDGQWFEERLVCDGRILIPIISGDTEYFTKMIYFGKYFKVLLFNDIPEADLFEALLAGYKKV